MATRFPPANPSVATKIKQKQIKTLLTNDTIITPYGGIYPVILIVRCVPVKLKRIKPSSLRKRGNPY
ncbi:hypothetical protein CMK22_17070 [Candidatus Poribacteria bacterium]|nr:hypothetical protein [Candidatus Poribacteria bacterium]